MSQLQIRLLSLLWIQQGICHVVPEPLPSVLSFVMFLKLCLDPFLLPRPTPGRLRRLLCHVLLMLKLQLTIVGPGDALRTLLLAPQFPLVHPWSRVWCCADPSCQTSL